MKMSDILRIMFIGTFLAVLYIHVQMSIYAYAYQGKTRQQKIDQLAERNAILQNDITRLRCSNHIGRTLLAKDNKEYQFVGKNNIVEVAAEERSLPQMIASSAKATGGFFSHVATTIALSSNR